MMNFYSDGRGLCLLEWLSHLFKSKNNRRRTLFCFGVCFVLLFSNQLQAQEPRRDSGADGRLSIRPLSVGDTIPDELWSIAMRAVNDPEHRSNLSLKDLNGSEFLILDFWATWCGSCVSSIRHFLTGSDYPNPRISYYTVTYQDEEEIRKFEGRFGLKFPSMIGDSLLREYFPHRTLPHVVIIRDGKLFATAGAEVLEGDGLASLLSGNIRRQDSKVDILDFDPTRRIDEQPNGKIRNAVRTSFTVLDAVPGLSGVNRWTADSLHQRILITNKSLREVSLLLLDSYWHNRVFLEVEDTGRWDFFNGYKGELSYPQWLAKYGVGADGRERLNTPRSAFYFSALSAICTANGLSLSFASRELPCYVIDRQPRGKKRKPDNGGAELKQLLYMLNYQRLDAPSAPLYVLRDPADSVSRINVDLAAMEHYMFENGPQKGGIYLGKVLEASGFTIALESRVEPVLIISERRAL
ncbi:TlpA family protein disulfide reductase [Sphingobacterium sp. LRF_L2]|uniref:TlpA family protein disulfide reductase n=1 Tax=Sphingobacterium sp. LRF_L2 TaxID=3369421 RepID=UPI003F5EEDED